VLSTPERVAIASLTHLAPTRPYGGSERTSTAIGESDTLSGKIGRKCWGSANRRGGREDRAAAVVRVVGRSAIVHPHTPEGSVSHGLAELREDDLHGMVALFEKWNDMLTRYFRESLKKGQS